MPDLLNRLRERWAEASGRLPTRAGQVTLVQRRIYVLPSGRGLFIIAVAIVLLLIGVNYQLALAYLVAFLLGGLMQVALHSTYRNLAGLDVRPGRSPLAREGETLVFALGLVSPGRRREGIRAFVNANCAANGHPRKRARVHSEATDLEADASGHLDLSLSGCPRGVHPLGRITLESRAPYGLIRAWSYVHFPWVGLIAPRPESPPPPLQFAEGAPDSPGRVSQVAHDPDSLREYVPGDSLRRVAWKQVAKSGQWFTRTGTAASLNELHLDWNALLLPGLEARLARMAAWVERARNENVAYRLTLPNGSLEMADGAAQARDAEILLAAYPMRPETIDGLRS